MAPSTDELFVELNRLWEGLPVPQPSWHPYVDQISMCRTDFERALALNAERPTLLLERFAALLDVDGEPGFDFNASPVLTAAWQRLEALPLPSGQHPSLDAILPALEAYRLLLIALSMIDEVP